MFQLPPMLCILTNKCIVTINEALPAEILFGVLQNIFSSDLLQMTLNASCKFWHFLTNVTGNWAKLAGRHMCISCNSFPAIQIQNWCKRVKLKKKKTALSIDVLIKYYIFLHKMVLACTVTVCTVFIRYFWFGFFFF